MTTHQEALEAAIAAANFSPVDPEAKTAMVAAIRAYLATLAPADNGLVERLRKLVDDQIGEDLDYIRAADQLMTEAADTITAQAAEIERLEAGWAEAFNIGIQHQERAAVPEALLDKAVEALEKARTFATFEIEMRLGADQINYAPENQATPLVSLIDGTLTAIQESRHVGK